MYIREISSSELRRRIRRLSSHEKIFNICQELYKQLDELESEDRPFYSIIEEVKRLEKRYREKIIIYY